MIIGIDASRATTFSPTGTENYSRQIIRALLQASSPLRFRLYTRERPAPGVFPATSNYVTRAIPFPRLWTHLRLSAEMLLHPPDALFVPAHVLPPVHPRRSIVTVHDLGYKYFPGAHGVLDELYLDLTTRWNANQAEWVIVDSEATRRDLERWYSIPSGKLRVIYPALNPEWAGLPIQPNEIKRLREKYALPTEYIISVGTVQPRKNYSRLVEAFARIGAPCTLVIVGKQGWLSQEVTRAIGQIGLGDRVRFLDYIDACDLPGLYAGAQLMAMASLYEGFGFPILEAQASGTPVACSNSSSLPEVAGDAAYFFDPQDVAAIAASLARLLTDAPARESLIERGRANIRRFSWARAADQILALIQ